MQGNQPSAEYLIPRIVVLGEVDRHKKKARAPSTTSFSGSLPPLTSSGVSVPSETGAAHRRQMRDKGTRWRLSRADLQTRIRPFPHPSAARETLLPRSH